jgi:hypothetical protein
MTSKEDVMSAAQAYLVAHSAQTGTKSAKNRASLELAERNLVEATGKYCAERIPEAFGTLGRIEILRKSTSRRRLALARDGRWLLGDGETDIAAALRDWSIEKIFGRLEAALPESSEARATIAAVKIQRA